MFKADITNKLQEQGYDQAEIVQYWDFLDADRLHPSVAYLAIDSCFHHGPGIVSFWLRDTTLLPLAQLEYIVSVRRRAIKTRLQWPDKRHEWTNQINRAKHYADKFMDETTSTASA